MILQHVYMRARVRTNMCACACVLMHVCARARFRARACVRARVRVYVCVCAQGVCVRACVRVHVCVCAQAPEMGLADASAKLIPDTVIVACPVVGPFGGEAAVGTGASYVNNDSAVPTWSTTFTSRASANPVPLNGSCEHVMLVVELHELVGHGCCASCAVTDQSFGAKFIPSIDSEPDPDTGPFGDLTAVTTGASKLSPAYEVPMSASTVAEMARY